MDIKIIINSLIIIFILHIIILNINYSVNIGNNKIENFSDKEVSDNEDSMKFLTSSDTSNEEFKKKLMKYIHVDEVPKETEFEDKNFNKVGASNTYLNDNNVPNFESNVADISKFYKINYDNLNEDQLKSTSIESLNKLNKTKEITIIDSQSKEPCNIKEYGRTATVTPDNWVYKDELPMNGGNMNGIVGFDNLESQFAIFNQNKLNLQSVNDKDYNDIPHNDLRKPIVYEN